jgi:hypothetical protein
MANGSQAFNLTCDCAMVRDSKTNADVGYCPLPDQSVIETYIDAIKEVWANDGCHTLDRENYVAQVDCGAGSWNSIISTAMDAKFQIDYWAQVQDPDNM